MTTYKQITLPNGDDLVIQTNAGASPMVILNGVRVPSTSSMYRKYLKLLSRDKEWESVIIWRPRKINGRWYWPGAQVYRRYSLSPGGGFWTYGDEFDILKND